MPPKQPQLGSLAIQAPSLTPKMVQVSPSTCHDISAFKDLMGQYRKLDDAINMRLNRTTAQFRDRERLGLGGGRGDVEEQACAHVWRELIANWSRRTEIVDYCVGVLDQSAHAKRQALQDAGDDASAQRRARGALYAEEVKRNQVRNELVVEDIVRRRTADAFRSRCRYFEPAPSDADATKWWNSG
ncbi:caffeine-induced death protein 2-domain-containing protein [Daedaleopsis nitida]|nr:caffeine-induced death protein 2-domain-containing protein [Daedaleopsis nitida]